MHGDKYRVFVSNNTGNRKRVSCPGQRKQMDNFFHFFFILRFLVTDSDKSYWYLTCSHSPSVRRSMKHSSAQVGGHRSEGRQAVRR